MLSNLFKVLLTIMTIPSVLGADFAYKKPTRKYSKIECSHEVKNMPSIRSQDGVGLCYGLVVTTLLDHYTCKQEDLDCSKIENQYSALDVSSKYGVGAPILNIGGFPATILYNIKYRKEKLHKEECIPFENLAHREFNEENRYYKGLQELEELYQQVRFKRNTPEQLICHAQRIKEILPINKSIEDILAIFENFPTKGMEEGLAEIVVVNECQENTPKEVPKYSIGLQDIREMSDQEVFDKISSLVTNNIPINLNFCTTLRNGNCSGGHAIVISGVRKKCDKAGKCIPLFKVHNSYGQGWQNQNNDGWLEALPLIENSKGFESKQSMTWIESDTEKIDSGHELPKKYQECLTSFELSDKKNILPVKNPHSEERNSDTYWYKKDNLYRCYNKKNYFSGQRPSKADCGL